MLVWTVIRSLAKSRHRQVNTSSTSVLTQVSCRSCFWPLAMASMLCMILEARWQLRTVLSRTFFASSASSGFCTASAA